MIFVLPLLEQPLLSLSFELARTRPGLSWFEIDVLKFDEQFFSKLSLIASVLTLTGILVFRSFMANSSIARIVVILSIAGSVLFLSVGMYYGLHEWTASVTNNIVDARFIAIVNTALEKSTRTSCDDPHVSLDC